MIGCAMLCEISKALSIAKENDAPFGGINVIFAGDFAQLPPIKQSRLYSQDRPGKGSKKLSQHEQEKNILGKLLWLSIQKVVVLTENMRQRVLENQDDFELLNTRLATTVAPDWNSEKWKDTPIIVAGNEAKDRLNEAATYAFAQRTRRPLHIYYPID
ncbi:hypothetical protein C8J56DRAFT_760913, partial [Mycena floridula]